MKKIKERLSITFDRECDEELLRDRSIVEYPMYLRCYKDALKAILKNIENNVLDENRNTATVYGYRDGEYGVPLHESNILAFLGKRGSGKTTVLREFGCILTDYQSHCKEWDQWIGYQRDKDIPRSFHVLPPIDASVLSATEDLVQVILANMYQEVIRKKGDCKGVDQDREELIGRIITQFDYAYKDYINVGNYGAKGNPGDSVLVRLRNVSDSSKTKAEFEKLTDSFLKITGAQCLVIIVDDLDMNPKKSFEMLEQLYKYFSNRKAVILIAVDYEQMYNLSQKNFVDILVPEYGGIHKKVYGQYEGKADKLADDYLLKVLPVENRIYLPEREQIYQEARVAQGTSAKLSVKEFLLGKIVEKTGIYYDACGLKKHFCLPDTVRELVSYIAFLDSLFSMEEVERPENAASGRQMVLYDQNHEHFNNDLQERMAIRLLKDEQLKLYRLIMARDVERRAGYMKCFVEYYINNKEKILLEERMHPIDSVDEQDFCYTDLVGALYKLGRRDYEDKALVHCLLASFTSEMVREYYSYRHNPSKDSRERAARRLKNFLGTTFGGQWMAETLLDVSSDAALYKTSLPMCYRKQVPVYDYEILIAENDLSWEDTAECLKEILLRNLPYVECISLLFANARDEAGRLITPEWKFEVRKKEESEEGAQTVLMVKGHVGEVDFDMFGFLGREIAAGADVPLYDEKLFQALEDCAITYCDNHGVAADVKRKIQTELRNKVRQKSIWNKAEENLAFPYYNFDMAYNVVKRVRRKMAERAKVTSEHICEYFRKTYGYMAQCLREEEDYYRKLFRDKSGAADLQEGTQPAKDPSRDNGSNCPGVPRLYESFMSAPFIKAFGAWDENRNTMNSNEDEVLKEDRLNSFLLETVKSLSVNVVLKDKKMQESE